MRLPGVTTRRGLMVPYPPDLRAVIDVAVTLPTWRDDPHAALSRACEIRCGGNRIAADELYVLLIEHTDAQIEIDGETPPED